MEIIFKTSIVDYLGETEDGVSILIGITVEDDFTFQGIYWIHPEGDYTFEVESDFLKLFGAEETEELPFLKELIEDINHIIGDKSVIFKEFLNNE